MKGFKKISKWFRVAFLEECDNCNRKLKKKWTDNWYSYKCKCGNKGFGHNYSNFGER